jgi:uncharacterized protein (TIGR01777 family)
MSRILVSGSSGFIGKELVLYLRQKGHTVVPLVRRKDLEGIYWNPQTAEIDCEQLEGCDQVIHLAGSPIFQGRWTKKKKDDIFLSRCRDTWVLSKALTYLKHPPSHFFSASAIGYYGNRGEEILTEASPPGGGFLAEVTKRWESSSDILEGKGIRVVHGRFGVVLSPKGGLLAKLRPIFRCGLGGQLGDGAQWMSWISLQDLIRAIDFTREHPDLKGSFNFTSPHPIRNSDFTKILAKSLHKPAFCHMPAFLLKAVFGELADEALLSSTRAIPKRLITSGFSFNDRYPISPL